MKGALQTLSVLCFPIPNQYFQENRWKFLPAILRPHLFFLILNSKIITNHPSWSSSATPGTTPTVPEAIIPDHLATPWLIVQRPTKWLPSMIKKESQWPLCSNPPKKSCFFCHFFVSFKNTSSSSFAHWPHTQPKTRPSTSHQQNFLERSPYIPKKITGLVHLKNPTKGQKSRKIIFEEPKSKPSHFLGRSNWWNFRCFLPTPFFGDHPINGHRHPTLEAHWKAAGSFFTAAVTSKSPPMRSYINIADLPIGSISQFVAGFWGPNHLVRIIWGK